MARVRHPDDDEPQAVPGYREVGGWVSFEYPIRYGAHEDVLIVRQHPGSKEATVALMRTRKDE